MTAGIELEIIGQLVAAGGLLHIFPSREKLAEFLSPLLAGIPGFSGAGVCFRDSAGPSGIKPGGQCGNCAARRRVLSTHAPYLCTLAEEDDVKVYSVESGAGLYGYLVLRVSDTAEYVKYEPFIKNLAGSLALTLENRQQRAELLDGKRLLERRIESRTAELEKARLDLQRKNTELEDLMFAASHDLRAPLINIQGFSENITQYITEIREAFADGASKDPAGEERLRKTLDQKLPEALGYVTCGAVKMRGMLDALLKVTRAGFVEISITEVDMDGLVRAILESIAFQIKEAGAEIKTGPLPRCAGDAGQLSQVFANLLENSVKYRNPERKLVVGIAGRVADDGLSEYTITDNGIGITKEEAAGKLWELFYRARSDDAVAGYGIGLSTSKRIVERHGGSISASPMEGGGARFIVRLPPRPTPGASRGEGAVPES